VGGPEITEVLKQPHEPADGLDGPFERALVDAVDRRYIVTDPELRERYEVDWMGRNGGKAAAIVRPSSAAEVAAVVRACGAHGIAVVPQGGNTGLVGGGVPRGGELVVSTDRLAWVGEVDTADGLLAVGAGATLAAARHAALACDLDIGIDLASRETATLGGMVSTNAGGLRVLRYGHMRAQLAGIEAVLPNGRTVRRMGGLRKDAVGWDLTGLFCGSEGTLGVVTSVLLGLVPATRSGATVLLGLDSLGDALAVAQRARRRCPSLQSAEVMFADGMALLRERFALRSPIDDTHACQLLLDFCSSSESSDAVIDEVAAVLADDLAVHDSALASDSEGRRRLLELRERHPQIIVGRGTPYKLDISMPLPMMVSFEQQVRAALAAIAPRAEVVLYGHLVDGSLHVNVAVADGDPAAGTVEGIVFGLVREHHGSVSAEHGVGVDKVRWAHYTRTWAELAVLRAVKSALDPAGIMNPGVLLPAVSPPAGAVGRAGMAE